MNKKTRFGTPGDIARLDIHDWSGRLIDRIKAKQGEKIIGIQMIERAKGFFGINDDILKQERNKLLEEEVEEHKKLFKPIKDDLKPIVWKRDSRGNIA